MNTVSHEEFIKIWQSSKNVTEVAKLTGLSNRQCSSRAAHLRVRGVPLKVFKPHRTPDWGTLKKLAEESLDDSH